MELLNSDSLQSMFAHKEKLDAFLKSFLHEQRAELESHSWSGEVIDLIERFSITGKSVRGTLFLEAAKLFGADSGDDLLPLSAALELLHSGLVIHDDIMDQDEQRRGAISVHTHFQNIATHRGFRQPRLAGESLAICTADICFFWAWRLFGTPKLAEKETYATQRFIGDEYVRVCLAQMKDVELGNANERVSETEILDVYRNKTGRYTISVPLVLAAIVSKQSEEIRTACTEIGEKIGVAFQMRDDYLNIFGSAETGKSIGSDIREGKQTIIRLLADQAVQNSQLDQSLLSYFGNENLTEDQVAYIAKQLRLAGVIVKMDKMIKRMMIEIDQQINELRVDSPLKRLLVDLSLYVTKRSR